ncbi:tripartite tricarboxylate transporter substrate binding protein [Pigmentiphaga soli]|uniref:Tripartite tricarboxylate transporter substrate binding protein n=1 Tax=Pigmentiphaga soli TaxID=1007095 RepID=A0ABP8HQN4_9BURK
MKTLHLAAMAMAALLGLAPAAPAAAAYPENPVKIIVGFPPGQSADLIARALAAKLGPALGNTTVIVDNRAGAAGIIGMQVTAKSSPDGYTLMMSSSTTLAINPSLYPKLPYDPLRDFAPVTLVAKLPLYLIVNADSPFRTLADFVDYAKAHPGKMNFGSAGNGLTNHLAMEMFKSRAKIDLVHVPYKGGPAAVTDLMAGRINAMFETGPGSLEFIKAGKLRALAVSSMERSNVMPDLPTIAESGYPGFEAIAWVGLVAPAGTPAAIVERLSSESRKILQTPEFASNLKALGGFPAGNTPKEFDAYIRSEMKAWGDAVRISGAKVD